MHLSLNAVACAMRTKRGGRQGRRAHSARYPDSHGSFLLFAFLAARRFSPFLSQQSQILAKPTIGQNRVPTALLFQITDQRLSAQTEELVQDTADQQAGAVDASDTVDQNLLVCGWGGILPAR